MKKTQNPRYEFRIFGNHLEAIEKQIREMAKEEQTRSMTPYTYWLRATLKTTSKYGKG